MFGFRVEGFSCLGLVFRVLVGWVLGFGFRVLGFWGLGFRVWGLRFRVYSDHDNKAKESY